MASKAERQAAFLEAYQETLEVSKAAEVAGIHRQRHYEWLREPDYAEQFAQAQQIGGATLEDEAVRRGRDGVRRYLWHQGQPIIDPETGEQAYRLEHSDALLIFLLKSIDPEKYRDRFDVRQQGSVRHTVELELWKDEQAADAAREFIQAISSQEE